MIIMATTEGNKLDMKIARAIHLCLKSQAEGEDYKKVVTAILNGAAAVIAGINRNLNFYDPEFVTYEVSKAWLEKYRVNNTASKKRNNDRIRTKKTRKNP